VGKQKPTVYVDTNIFSAMYGRPRSASNTARKQKTLRWWKLERAHFALFASRQSEIELLRGRYDGQDAAIAAVRRWPYLTGTNDLDHCVKLRLKHYVVPESEPGDAIQLSFAITHRIDYLLN